jgi:hypothetical protein
MINERRLSSIIVIAATGMLLTSPASYSAQTTSNLKPQDAPTRIVDLSRGWGVLQDVNPTSTLFPMILAKAGEHAAELLCFQCGLAKTSRIVTNYYRGVLT